jgi:hypothetical protein
VYKLSKVLYGLKQAP